MRATPSRKPLTQRIKRLYLLQAQAIDDELKSYGLARSQWQVLSHVRAAGSMTQKELQGLLEVEPATLTCIIDTLVTKGWLERLGHETDKRVKVVRFTADGERRWEAIPDVTGIVGRRMAEGVSERDMRALERAIERMTDNLGRRQAE